MRPLCLIWVGFFGVYPEGQGTKRLTIWLADLEKNSCKICIRLLLASFIFDKMTKKHAKYINCLSELLFFFKGEFHSLGMPDLD